MKRILSAGLLAIGIHGLLFGMNFKWTGNIILDRPKARALNMTLTSIPVKTTPRPSPQKPKPVLKKPVMVKKEKKKPAHKPVLKTPLKKSAKVPVRSKKSKDPKTISEKTAEKSESQFEARQSALKTSLKAEKHTAATISPLKTIQKARPVYRSNPSPEYPRIARIRGYQGNVLLDVLVNKYGKVHDLKIFRSSGYPILDKAAISSVKYWLFKPGMIGKEKVKMWVRVPIRFELKE